MKQGTCLRAAAFVAALVVPSIACSSAEEPVETAEAAASKGLLIRASRETKQKLHIKEWRLTPIAAGGSARELDARVLGVPMDGYEGASFEVSATNTRWSVAFKGKKKHPGATLALEVSGDEAQVVQAESVEEETFAILRALASDGRATAKVADLDCQNALGTAALAVVGAIGAVAVTAECATVLGCLVAPATVIATGYVLGVAQRACFPDKPAGDECTEDSQCASGTCRRYANGDSDKHCFAGPDIPPGASVVEEHCYQSQADATKQCVDGPSSASKAQGVPKLPCEEICRSGGKRGWGCAAVSGCAGLRPGWTGACYCFDP